MIKVWLRRIADSFVACLFPACGMCAAPTPYFKRDVVRLKTKEEVVSLQICKICSGILEHKKSIGAIKVTKRR